MEHRTRSVGIVGVGNVGVAGAYALYLREACEELVLVDMNKARAEGEALDLMHGQGLTGRMQVSAGEFSDLARCQVIVVTAGVGQKSGESRLELLENNAKVFKSIAEQLDRYAPSAIVVVASNPVDVLTFMLQELSQRPKHRIIGTGTMLDTSRLKTLLGEIYQVDPQSVHGYILGEHGDSELAAWSTVSIGGLAIQGETVFGVSYSASRLEELAESVKQAAYKIIEGKGYTNLAIGVVIARLVEAILDDSKTVLPVSVRLSGEYQLSNVALSLPACIGLKGVEKLIELPLESDELAALQKSGETMRESLSKIGF
ncbi:L-lactate dehydrogenase [Agarivorans litoreus]|uniref:L-lactate dehydrogenase n=1 Tax=Agarivorans litoreus TaxID=1510455 RepID=UPI001C7DC122|nr:L-lactate dehydrogenase [Agarivorans litoreus]